MSECGNNLDKMTIRTLNDTTRSKCECKMVVEGKMKLHRALLHFRKTIVLRRAYYHHTLKHQWILKKKFGHCNLIQQGTSGGGNKLDRI